MKPFELKLSRLADPLRMVHVPRHLTESQSMTRQRLQRAFSDGVIKLEDVGQCMCGQKELYQLARRDGFGFDFAALLCMRCGLVLTSPVIADASIPFYYSEYYHDLQYPAPYAQHEGGTIGRGRKIFHILKQILPTKTPLNVLDVGAAHGNVIVEFIESARKSGLDVRATVTEYNPQIREKLKDQVGVRIVIGGVEDLLDYGELFDVVILSHVLEHIRNIPLQLAHLKPLLTPKTLVYVEVPGIMTLHSHWGADFLRYFVHPHFYHFNLLSISHVMALSGFKPIWGNELVEAVYKLGPATMDMSTNAQDILDYLQYIERGLALHEALRTLPQRTTSLEDRIRALEISGKSAQRELDFALGALEVIREFPPARAYLFLRDMLRKLGRPK